MQNQLTRPAVIWLKGGLFLLLGFLAGGLLIARLSDLQSILLLAIAVWAFCRAYYFAFYVIGHYVDPGFRYAGLLDFAKYAISGQRAPQNDRENRQKGARGLD